MNTKEMTLQDVFNTAYIGLASQGFERSMLNDGCAYRGAEGRKCAIGYCIPDEEYSPDMEGLTAHEPSIARLFPLVDAEEMRTLQRVHDNATSGVRLQWRKDWENREHQPKEQS